MYMKTFPGIFPAAQRNMNPNNWYNLAPGGEDVVMYSASINWDTCSAVSHLAAVEPGCTAIDFTAIEEHLDESGLLLYPNPTDGLVYVKTGLSNAQSIQLFSLSGSLIETLPFTRQHQTAKSSIYSLELSHVPDGMYILHIQTNEGMQAEQIVIQ